jgi:hypothetical protein
MLALCWTAAVCHADEHAAVAPYLANDVSSVLYFDLDKLKLPTIAEELEKLNLIPESELPEAKRQTTAIQAKLDEVFKRGARRAYLLVRVSDFFQGGPTLVVEVAEEGQAQAVAEWLTQWAANADALGDAAAYLPKTFVADGSAVVGAGSQQRLAKVRAKQDSRRPEAIEALAALGGAHIGWVAFGDSDSRRVVREMFPQLPAPFMEIDGKLLADGLKWIGVTFTLPPDPTVTVSINASSEEVAGLLSQAVDKVDVLAKGYLLKEMLDGPPAHKLQAKEILPVLSLLKSTTEGTQLSLTFGDNAEEKQFLRNMLPVFAKEAMTKASLNARMNRFKQIVLGIFNYESAKGSFPAAASYSDEGKPLLSWRVLILPYVDQVGLYKEFHLDEPWDSDHNRKLIERMPDIYADPDLTVRTTLEKGRTTYVLPVGKGMIFESKELPSLRGVTDGTSNTILTVEVVPERAVIWTQPADWEVDLNKPLEGITRNDREFFTVGMADGSVRIMPKATKESEFKALLTRAGNEPITH